MPKQTKFKFKDAFARLEKIVSELGSSEADLEEVMQKYEEGLELVKACKGKLEETENKIKEIKAKA